MQLGSWATNFQHEVPVTGGDDFQVLEVEFPDFAGNCLGTEEDPFAHVIFQNGWVVGTSIIKKVQVVEKGGTGIKNVKAEKALNNVRYNLAGQKVDASYKGIVIMNGKKFIQK